MKPKENKKEKLKTKTEEETTVIKSVESVLGPEESMVGKIILWKR